MAQETKEGEIESERMEEKNESQLPPIKNQAWANDSGGAEGMDQSSSGITGTKMEGVPITGAAGGLTRKRAAKMRQRARPRVVFLRVKVMELRIRWDVSPSAAID